MMLNSKTSSWTNNGINSPGGIAERRTRNLLGDTMEYALQEADILPLEVHPSSLVLCVHMAGIRGYTPAIVRGPCTVPESPDGIKLNQSIEKSVCKIGVPTRRINYGFGRTFRVNLSIRFSEY